MVQKFSSLFNIVLRWCIAGIFENRSIELNNFFFIFLQPKSLQNYIVTNFFLDIWEE